MVDPITALATATAAFNVIKKGFSMGRDIESMYGDMGRWMGAVSDIGQAEKMPKNPPRFKKIFTGSSVDEEALNAFAARKKAKAMEDELRSFVNLTYGPTAWDELLRLQSKIRKERKEMIYKQQERKEQIIEWIVITIAVIFGTIIVGWVAMMLVSKANAEGRTYVGDLPREPKYTNCRLIDQKPMYNKRKTVVTDIQCKYKYPNVEEYMYVTVGDRYRCPSNLECKLTE